MNTLLLDHALLPDGIASRVEVTIKDGRFTSVRPATDSTAPRLEGLTLPGMANCHSHAFHRALRGHTQAERGTFWTWRDQMYAVAQKLTPDSYYDLARATYAEMVSTGITTVGEFHYIHHQPDGSAYADPNAMGSALIAAARDVGMRITLLDTCYLASGFGTAPVGAQIRYSDGSAEAWATRVAALNEDAMTKVGAALHSVRAVPKNEMPTVVAAAQGKPLHVHLSEQVAENEACQAAHQQTPTQLLADVGALGINTSAVHATHLTQGDIALLGDSHTTSCFCPTTERDLGDGIGPSRELLAAGSPLSLGSDSHAVIDLFEEMRALEMNERLATQARGHWSGIELVEAATRHDSLGWADVGRIEVGAQADLVTISMTSPTTAGCAASYETVAMATSSYDVRQVRIAGKLVFEGDRDTIGTDLTQAIAQVRQ